MEGHEIEVGVTTSAGPHGKITPEQNFHFRTRVRTSLNFLCNHAITPEQRVHFPGIDIYKRRNVNVNRKCKRRRGKLST